MGVGASQVLSVSVFIPVCRLLILMLMMPDKKLVGNLYNCEQTMIIEFIYLANNNFNALLHKTVHHTI